MSRIPRNLPNRKAVESLESTRTWSGQEYMVYLKPGYTVDPVASCRTFGADTMTEVRDVLKLVRPWDGPEPE